MISQHMGDSLVKRSDYRPPAHAVDATRLTVRIFSDHTTIDTEMDLRPMVEGGGIFRLYGGEGLTLDAMTIGGSPYQPEQESIAAGEIALEISEPVVVSTRVTIYPKKNTALEGLYLSNGMYCTQCEPEGFRHITWYPDRSDTLSVFTTRIEADNAFPTLLSNGNLVSSGTLKDGRHFAEWHDPHPKPSYLFALVAGDLDHVEDHYKTMENRDVTLRIYVEKGNTALTDHAMKSLKKSMKWDEEVYGLSYDLDIFMIVAVSYFNMGAMENKGLNIFNSKYVLADGRTASDDDLDNVEAIIAHEYFHNWTGNRITCRDWFQLTLKEGLTVFRDQEFSADMHSRGVKRAGDVALLRSVQFPEDSGPTAHPIRPDFYMEINNFYTPTVYEKGAEVIRMISTMLGHDRFMKGIDHYIKTHDGSAATCEDFVESMEKAGNIDLTQFRHWYEQAGTPHVSVGRAYDQKNQTLTLTFEQSIPELPQNGPRHELLIPITVGMLGADGAPLKVTLEGENHIADEKVLLIDKKKNQFTFTNVPEGAVPSILRNFSAPVIIKDDLTTDERLQLLSSDSDIFGRWDSGQTLMSDLILDDARKPEKILSLAKSLSSVLADNQTDHAEKAQILCLPTQEVLESARNDVDPVAIWRSRREVSLALTLAMKSDIDKHLETLLASIDALTSADRKLLERLLAMVVLAGDEGAIASSLRLSRHPNMTVSMAGLRALNQTARAERAEALAEFAERWKNDSLVMEKWFALESAAPLVTTSERCDELMKHRAFDAGNPNKLRSVLSVFAMANIPNFHAETGKGYAYLAQHIARIDARNPQVAARMALPLTRFGRYDLKRQSLMIDALRQIKASKTLSRDLSEIVGKAIGAVG